jgi:hypothetical protein
LLIFRYFFIFIFCLYLPVNLSGQEPAATKTEIDSVKAAYIFNFIKFIDWPATPENKEMVICIIGNQTIEKVISGLALKDQGSKKVRVQHDIESACNIIFVYKTQYSEYEQTLLLYENKPVLTISDYPAFLSKEGIIELYAEKNKLNFNINNTKAKNNRLLISSKLLRLAKNLL